MKRHNFVVGFDHGMNGDVTIEVTVKAVDEPDAVSIAMIRLRMLNNFPNDLGFKYCELG